MSYICKVSIIFGKGSFLNAKKVLNFIQSLINENRVIKSLTAFHNQWSNQKLCTSIPACKKSAKFIYSFWIYSRL